jgi:hypothetical protein
MESHDGNGTLGVFVSLSKSVGRVKRGQCVLQAKRPSTELGARR